MKREGEGRRVSGYEETGRGGKLGGTKREAEESRLIER